MTYTATLTPSRVSNLVFTIRVHETPNCEPVEYGADWVYGCMVERVIEENGEMTAFMSLTLRAPTPDQTKAMRETLKAAGFTHREHERWKRGKMRVYRQKL